MSTYPELYDLLLSALSDKKVDLPPPSVPEEVVETKPKVKLVLGGTKSKKLAVVEDPKPHIEMVEKPRPKKKKKQNIFLPALLLIAGVAIIFVALQEKKPKKSVNAINLLRIKSSNKFNPDASQRIMKEGVGLYLKDNFSNYIKAEESFLRSLDENPKNPEAAAMLALTYMELWPYAKKDSNDAAAIREVSQRASTSDPYGVFRMLALIAGDLSMKRDATARSQVDSALSGFPGEGRLYFLKARMFFEASDFQSANAYFEKAQTLSKDWVAPIYFWGVGQNRMGAKNEARDALTRALSLNPNHVLSRIELGMLELEGFGQLETAIKYLNVALSGDEMLPPLAEARARYGLAKIYQKTGQATKARIEIRRAAALDPLNPDIALLAQGLGENSQNEPQGCAERMALGEQYQRISNYLGAQAQFKSAFRCDPKNAAAAMKAAENLWRLRQAESAIEYLKKAIQADPKFLESYILLADYHSRLYDFDEAFKTLESAGKVDRNSYLVYRGLAQVALRREDFVSADVYARQANKIFPNDIQNTILMATISRLKKDPSAAMSFARSAIQLDKNNPEAQIAFAEILAEVEGPNKGAEYLKELINTFPNQVAYRTAIAKILLDADQPDGAAPILEQVIVADPDNKDAHVLLGDASLKLNFLDKAINNYFEAVKIDPSDMAPAFKAGETYLKARDFEMAMKQFRTVLERNPRFPRAHLKLANAFWGAGLTDEALEALEEEKKRNPKLAESYEMSGDIFLETRKAGLASKEYQKAIDLGSPGCSVFIKMAIAYRNQGLLDAALAMLKSAVQKESGCSGIYREQGTIFEAKGMSKEAIAAYKQYLSLEPTAKDKETIKDKIEDLE